MRSTLSMGQRVPPLNEDLFDDISGYILAKDQPKASPDLLCGYRTQVWQTPTFCWQSVTLKTTRTAGGKDQCHVEVEEAMIEERDCRSSK